MKNRIYLFMIPSILLGLSALYLCSQGIDGWGWFLFGSLATFAFPDKVIIGKDDDAE